MSSLLSKQRDYKYIAEKYSELNGYQVELGKNLLDLTGVNRGDKVLDMGCGTGELASFIADQVGEKGRVHGIDPDQERIEVAVRKHCGTKLNNLKFVVGDSSSNFPHFNEEYYDIHFSNFVFHWLTTEEKDAFIKTAVGCLKPGGIIAIHSAEKNPEMFTRVSELFPDEDMENNRAPVKYVAKSLTESMLLNSGFEIVSSEFDKCGWLFSNLDEFIRWYCASDYVDESKILPHKKQAFAERFVNEDGTVFSESEIYRIIAKKMNTRC